MMSGHQLQLDQPVELQTLWEFVESFRERAQAILYQTVCQRAARLAAWVIDQRALEMPPLLAGREYAPSDSPLEVAYRVILGSFFDAYEVGRGPAQELEAHLVVFPSPDLLAILHTDNDAVRRSWEATAGVSAFPYRRAPEMGDAEWAVRRAAWESVLVQSSGGLRIECFGRYGLIPPTIEDVLPYVPVRKARAVELGFDRALGAWLRRQQPSSEEHIPFIVLEGLRYLREERAGNAAVQGEAEEIEPLLPLIDYESFSA